MVHGYWLYLFRIESIFYPLRNTPCYAYYLLGRKYDFAIFLFSIHRRTLILQEKVHPPDRGGGLAGGGSESIYFWTPQKIPPCNEKSPKNENFSPVARFYYICVLYFDSNSAPQAKILDIETRKKSKGGIF